MKIAILGHLHYPIRQPYAGGLEMHTHMLADELVARGHDVTLYAKGGTKCNAKVVPVLNRRYTFRSYSSKILREFQEARVNISVNLAIDLIKVGQFDYVINNSLNVQPYTRLTNMPMLTILHTPATLERVNKVIERNWSAPEKHRYVSVSESNAVGWRKLLPSVGVVPNGIRLNEWKTLTQPEKNTAVWAGRITPEKGLHIAIKAAQTAGMKLKIAGPISNKKYFKKEIKPLLDDSITHVGHLNHAELAAFFASGEVAISSPLWEEPFGLSTVEALAAGTPVAALPHGAMRDIVISKVGSVSRTDDPTDLAEAIATARTKSRRDCQTYTERYGIEPMVDAYEQIMCEQIDPTFGKKAIWPTA